MYGPDNDLLRKMYKHFHDSLKRYLIDVHCYDVFMHFHYLYFVLMMFGRVHYKKWDPGIAWFQFWGQQVVMEIESPLEKVSVIIVVQQQAWCFLFETFLES